MRTTAIESRVNWDTLLSGMPEGQTVIESSPDQNIFSQGMPADSLYYLRAGKVKLVVKSAHNKDAITAVINAGEFFGEGCLAGQSARAGSAVTLSNCTMARIDKAEMVRVLHEKHDASELFVRQLLNRNIRYEGDLVDQLFNNSERRLARVLLSLAQFTNESKTERVIPGVSQESLAQMVGTTRSRVSHFMNKFRKLGFIDYQGDNLTVHSGLRDVVLPG
jgi:CRP/FNR family cyclic AMP-dependent transcriptional regulator